MGLQNIKPFLEGNEIQRRVEPFLQHKSVTNELDDRIPLGRPWMDNVQHGWEPFILENQFHDAIRDRIHRRPGHNL